MPEGMYGPVLLMAGFFGAVVLLMVALSPLFSAAIDTGATTDRTLIEESFIQDADWEQWEPSTFTVTDSCQSNGIVPENDVCVTFDTVGGGDDHPLDCVLVRNATWPFGRETDDYWMFWQTYGWFGIEVAETWISLDTIEDAYNADEGIATLILDLRYNFKMLFWVDNLTATETFRDRLDNNLYNMSLGISINDTLSSVSPWSMIGKLMTFRMPGTNIVTNALIAIPIYTALIYIAFAIIRSVIPLLGG